MRLPLLLSVIILLASCKTGERENKVKPVNWDKRTINVNINNDFQSGRTYLPIYSEIYDQTDETTHLLTATVSIRNTSLTDSLFITTADYYNTKGELIRSYTDKTIFLAPMETIEIVIPRLDSSGGTGANFNFEWSIKNSNPVPLFEAVMVWTTGNQGISFVTRGVNTKF